MTCQRQVFILNPAAASVRHLKDLLSKLASKLAEGRKDAASVDAWWLWGLGGPRNRTWIRFNTICYIMPTDFYIIYIQWKYSFLL